MSERFSQIFTSQPNLGVEDTPVIIRAGALLLDNQTKKLIAQFKMQSISDKEISLVKIKIVPQDSIQRDLDGDMIYEYLDLNCNFKDEFGQKKPIYISNPATRSFKVAICEVAFKDGSVWTNSSNEWSPLNNSSITVRRFAATVTFQEALRLKNEDTVPKLEEAIKLFESVAEFKEVGRIIELCQSRISELNAQALQEEQARQAKAKRAKKIAAIVIPCIIAVIIIILFINFLIVPSVKYNKAMDLIEAGNDEEAANILYEIYGFKDSEDHISGIHKRAIERANAAYLKGDCEIAEDILSAVNYTGREYSIYSLINDQNYSEAISTYDLTSIIIPNGTTTIKSHAFYGCDKLVSVTIPNSVTEIEGSAFSGCTRLTSITIPNDVKRIGSSAFSGCTNLTSVVIPDSVISIEGSVFTGCSNLTSVTLSKNITSIPPSAFQDCEKLESISIPESVDFIYGSAFYNCTALKSVALPDKLSMISSKAFYKCTSLTSITLPDTLGTIQSSAFSGCKNLEKIVIPISVKVIGYDAFEKCDNLTIFCEAESRPNGWEYSSYGYYSSSSWNSSSRPVIWGSTGETYTYTFETNGGSAVSDIASYEKIALPTTTKSGMVFMGWYDNAEFSGKEITSPYYSTTKHKLYAKWMSEEEYIASCDGTSFEKAFFLKLDENKDGYLSSSSQDIYYRFTPTETKSYTISASDDSTGSYYYTSDKIYLYFYTDPNKSYTNRNYGTTASITYTLEAGHTY